MMDNSCGQWQLAAQNKRKEKARIAARARRSQEANIIMEMASELHISQEKLRRIDKATIVKLAIDYLKAHEILSKSSPPLAQANTPPDATLEIQTPIQQQQQEAPMPNEQISNIENKNLQHLSSNNKNNRHCNYSDEDSKSSLLLELPTKFIKIDIDQQQAQLRQQPQPQLQTIQPLQPIQRQQQQKANKMQQSEQYISPYSAPILTTSLIFAPKTSENSNEHYLMIDEKYNGDSKFILKPDTEISDEDDLTHLAPQAGDISISLEANKFLEQQPTTINMRSVFNHNHIIIDIEGT